MKHYRADSAAVRLLQIPLFAAAGLLCLGAELFLPVPFTWAVICIVVTAALLLGFVCLPLWMRSLRCEVSHGQISVFSGILFRREQTISLQSIQFIQSIRGPKNGAWGMNFLVLYVCGGKLTVRFLRPDDCRALTEFLQQKGGFHVP